MVAEAAGIAQPPPSEAHGPGPLRGHAASRGDGR